MRSDQTTGDMGRAPPGLSRPESRNANVQVDTEHPPKYIVREKHIRKAPDDTGALFQQFTRLLEDSSSRVLHEVMAHLIAELDAQRLQIIVWRGGGWNIEYQSKDWMRPGPGWLRLENALDNHSSRREAWTKTKSFFLVYSSSYEHQNDASIFDQIRYLLRPRTLRVLERALGLLVSELLHRHVDIMVWRAGGWTIGKLTLREWEIGHDWIPMTNDPKYWSTKASTYDPEISSWTTRSSRGSTTVSKDTWQ